MSLPEEKGYTATATATATATTTTATATATANGTATAPTVGMPIPGYPGIYWLYKLEKGEDGGVELGQPAKQQQSLLQNIVTILWEC